MSTALVVPHEDFRTSNEGHPWIRALEAFGIPFITYQADGSRTRVSTAANELMTAIPSGCALGRQADRVVADELTRSVRQLKLGRFILVREASGCCGRVLLAVHVVYPAVDEVTAIVVMRACGDAAQVEAPMLGLTPREAAVARLIAVGLATKEIAHRLGISVHTARHHTERVFSKMGVRTRSAVAALVGAHSGARGG